MEVVLADGGSTDQTLHKIESFKSSHPDLSIKLINNPLRHIPAALNRAISAASGEIIIRMDAHSLPGRIMLNAACRLWLMEKEKMLAGNGKFCPVRTPRQLGELPSLLLIRLV